MIDQTALLNLKEIMGSDFQHLVEIFIQDSSARIQQLADLISTGDADEIRKMAHSIKGSSANLYASKMSELCFDLEQQAQDFHLANAPMLQQRIAEEFVRVKEELLSHWV